MLFSSNLLGKLMLETFFQHKLFVKNVFKYLCFKQFFFKSIFRTLVGFFKLLFGLPTTNFEPLLRGQPHSSDGITTFLQFWLECQGTLEWGWVPKPGDYPWGLNRWPINSNYNALTHKGFLHYGVSVLWIYCMCVRSFHHVWFKILHFSSLAQHRWYNLRKSKEAYLISFKVSS